MDQIVVSPDDLHEAAATWLAGAIRRSVSARGRCCLALSGGSSPLPMFDAMVPMSVPWGAVHLFQVDERIGPDGHGDRNGHHLRERLVERVPIPRQQVHLMVVDRVDPTTSARAYDRLLRSVCGGVLDIAHLGLGPDGHTASWAPGDPVIQVRDRLVATTHVFNGRARMTLTVPAVNRARVRLLEVGGASKAPALAQVLAGDRTVPGALLEMRSLTLVADHDALPARG